jgi:putative inorganic carbon (HCO3(-)) transporter
MSIAPRGRLQGLLCPVQMSRYLTYAFIITMPWAGVFAESVNPHDAARMFQSLIACIAAFALLQLGGPWWPRARTSRAVLLVVVVFGCLSVGLAEKTTYAALEASAMVLLVIMVAVLARTDTDVLLRELPAVVALSSLLAVLLELPRLLYSFTDGRVPQAADFGFMYMSHRFFNHTQSVMLPMAFLPLLVPAQRWVRAAAWAGLMGGLALLWRTGGRGTIVAIVVFAVVLPCVLRARAGHAVRTMMLAAIGAAVIYLVCFITPAVLLGLAPDNRGNAALRIAQGNDSGRFYLWKLALDDAVQHPWAGIGPMHYAHLPNLLAAHPHNSVAQWAAEWGMPVTLCVLAVLGALLFRATRELGRAVGDVKTLLTVTGLAVLVGAIDSLFSGTLVMPVSQTWWFIALGCMLAVFPGPSMNRAMANLALRGAIVVALVALHVGLSVLTYQRSIEPPKVTEAGLQRTNVPRYWINGFF